MQESSYILAAIVLPLLGTLFYFFWNAQQRTRRRDALKRQALPQAWRDILTKNIGLYRILPEHLQEQLHGLIQVFLSEKGFVGCEAQEITDEVRVTIAGQACMLLLNRKTRFYPKLKTIYVYPEAYVVKTLHNKGGVVTEEESVRLGESWTDGPLVLSWDSVTGGARNVHDGRNVVFHEFAHQLDQEDGTADGAPLLDDRSGYRSWAAVLGAEFETLRRQKKKGRRSVLNKYGASHPAEFFAVATEAFFEKPKQLQKRCPDLYEELKGYYQVDPLEFAKP
jgi:Mlc titration factor MtfA (ptsG expression regulator)